MARAQGFGRGDLDPAFPLDDKFLDLRGRLSPERYYAASGVYFHAAAAAWRNAERKAAAKTCPDAGDLIAELQAVGLLDAEGCLPRRAYLHTIGRALRARKVSTDRKTRNRVTKTPSDADRNGKSRRLPAPSVQIPDQLSRGTERDSHARHAASTDIQNSPEQSSTDQVSTDSLRAAAPESETRNGFDKALWTQVQRLGEELTGVAHALPNPYSGFGAQALGQATAVPWPAFEAAYRQVAAVYGQPTARQLVFDAETVLRPTGRAAVRGGPEPEPDPEEVRRQNRERREKSKREGAPRA